MATWRSLSLAFVIGIVGIFVGHALPRGTSKPDATATAPSTLIPTGPISHDCKAECGELSSTKAQLAICKAYLGRASEAAPSTAPNPESEPPKVRFVGGHRSSKDVDQITENQQRLDTYSEAVIVVHSDGKTKVYKPDEWPSDGDGQIVARKLSNGQIGWYGGPDAGPRSDPAAFKPRRPDYTIPVMVTQPDGAISLYGVEDPALQEMIGRKVRDAGP